MFIGQLIIVQVVTFVVLIFFLRILFYRHLSLALARLKKLNEENLAREEVLKKELERATRERESEIAKGREEGKKMVKEAKKEAERIKDESFLQAKEQVKAIIADAEKRAKRIEEDLRLKLDEQTLEISCEMVKHIFKGKGKDALHSDIIDELIGEINSIDKEKLKTDQKQVLVSSAYPLSAEQKKKLESILFSKTGTRFSIEEKIEKDIVMGIVVKLGTLVIDGSLRNKLKRIVPYLKKWTLPLFA